MFSAAANPVQAGACHIAVYGGVNPTRYLLSCKADGTVDDLYNVDDGSGRQQWMLSPVPQSPNGPIVPCYFYIAPAGGVNNTSSLLSAVADGSKLVLAGSDDGSGLQWFQIQGAPWVLSDPQGGPLITGS